MTDSVARRLAGLPWPDIERDLWERGYSHTEAVLTPEECRALVGLYDDDGLFRSRVDMGRHRFGEGEYKYFAAPLPPLVQELRTHAYPRLAPLANAWMDALRLEPRFPATLAELQRLCAKRGQTRPTP